MTSLPKRRVRHLRVAAADESLARRALPMLEDAFHTATLPFAESGRLVAIRKLDLGRVAAHASGASIALQLEQRVRQLAASAIHVETAGAAFAPAVFFHDRA